MRIDVPNSGTSHAIERGFNYSEAFSRNIGWVSEFEQQTLRKKTVAIAGMGGVGGAHALTLARLGIGGFHIADFDRFDVVNLNRQAGAFISTVNLEKAPVMAQMMRDINPELRLEAFSNGLDEHNLDAFLDGVDLFVDGLDFFAIDIRRKAFKRCYELNIPAITAAPIGFGTSYLIFMPGKMSFEEYFRLEGLSEERQYVNFALGLTPKGFHRSYLVDPSRLDLAGKRGPSTAAAIQLCSGVVGAEAVKILAQRGKIYAAPAYHQFDAYRGRWHRGYLRHGNAGPLQSLKRHVGYRAFEKLSKAAQPKEESPSGSEIEQILDIARWAPSGDNAQPWRFEILNDEKLIVHLHIESEEKNIYEFSDGQPSLLAGGFLLETMRIAASRFSRTLQWKYLGSRNDSASVVHRIEVDLSKDESVKEDPLLPFVTIRSVDRRAYKRRPLSDEQKESLRRALGGMLDLEWRESLEERAKLARLCAAAGGLRLSIPETYSVHRRILDWERVFSPDSVPAASVGIDTMTVKLMRFVLQDWRRVRFFNRFLAGTLLPRIELDLIPGLFSAGYFVLSMKGNGDKLHSAEDLLRAGGALQRFWLTATSMGLSLQPTLAPLCFAHYGRSGSPSSVCSSSAHAIKRFAKKVEGCFSDDGSVIFLGRIGTSRRSAPASRSIRQPVSELMV